MKKLIISVTVILLCIALIGPKLAGNSLNQSLDNYAEALNSSGVYKIDINDRSESWFNTSAILTLRVVIPEAFDQPESEIFSVDIDFKAQHGPILTDNGVGLGWVSWTTSAAGDSLGALINVEEDGPLYFASGKIGIFGGGTSISDKMLPFTYTDPETQVTMSVNGWEGNGFFGNDSTSYSGEFGGMNVNAGEVLETTLGNWEFRLDADASYMDIVEGKLYNGTIGFTLDSLKVNNEIDNSVVNITNFMLEAITSLDSTNDTADIQTNFQVERLDATEMLIEQIQLNTQINKLSQSFARAYQQMNNDILQEPERAAETMQDFMQEHLLVQLQTEPEFNITQLEAQVDGGNFSMVSNNKLSGINSLPDTMEDPAYWLQHTVSDTQLTVDKPAALFIAKQVLKAQLANNPQIADMEEAQFNELLTQQSEATLGGLVQQGMLSETENGFTMSFSLSGGKAELNGNPMPLPIQ
ncbi:DUF945 family protein [Ningiella sp. W23]|uniref:DUF945 family protein n=1 Tax=Ningiella sp. W23 TaxID=3023715 RepID=UPI003757AA5B